MERCKNLGSHPTRNRIPPPTFYVKKFVPPIITEGENHCAPQVESAKMLMPPLNLAAKKALAPPSDRCEKPVGPPTPLPGGFSGKFWSLP